MRRVISLRAIAAIFLILGLVSINAQAQTTASIPDFSGTWSDPPPRAEDAFCHIGCMLEARDYLTSLLNDPANIDRSYAELKQQALRFQITELLPGYMTAEALEARKNRSRPPASAVCEPWGLVRTSMAPHAMELTQYEDRITLYYSEWTALRTVYLDKHDIPDDLELSKYGYSIGHYDGDNLVVETTGIVANNFAQGGFPHSDQVKVTERFTRIDDRLEVEVTLTDPLNYTEPLRLGRAWAWAPGEEIFPYDNCVIPSE